MLTTTLGGQYPSVSHAVRVSTGVERRASPKGLERPPDPTGPYRDPDSAPGGNARRNGTEVSRGHRSRATVEE